LYASAINSSVLGVGGVWKSCTPWNSSSWVEVLNASFVNASDGTGQFGAYTLKVLNTTYPNTNGHDCLFASEGGNGSVGNAVIMETCDGNTWSTIVNATYAPAAATKIVGLNVFNGDLLYGVEWNNTGTGAMTEYETSNSTIIETQEGMPVIIGVWNGSWYLGLYNGGTNPTFDLQRNNTLVSGSLGIPILQINTGDAAQGTMITGFYNTTQSSQNVLYVSLDNGGNGNSSRNSTDGLNWNAILNRGRMTNFVNYSVDNNVYVAYEDPTASNYLLSSSDLKSWSVNATLTSASFPPMSMVEFNKHLYITSKGWNAGPAPGFILIST